MVERHFYSKFHRSRMKKPRRKRLYYKKRKPLSGNVEKVVDPPTTATGQECPSTSSSSQFLPPSSLLGTDSNCGITETATCVEDSIPLSIHYAVDHDYGCFKPPPAASAAHNSSGVEDNVLPDCDKPPSPSPPAPSPPAPVCEMLMTVKTQLDSLLPCRWLSFLESNSITVICMSPGSNSVTQRSLEFSVCGNVKLFVHCQEVNVDPYMADCGPFVPLYLDTVTNFVDRAHKVIENVKSKKICSGYDDEKFQSFWSMCPLGIIDKNPYREDRYIETFRSAACSRLVSPRKWRCSECAKLYLPLKRRSCSAAVERPRIHTANKHLTEKQMLQKLQDQAREIGNANRKTSHLKANMQSLLEKNGVQIDEAMSDDLTNLLEGPPLMSPPTSASCVTVVVQF